MIPPLTQMLTAAQLPPARPVAVVHPHRIALRIVHHRDPPSALLRPDRLLVRQRTALGHALVSSAVPHRSTDLVAEHLVQLSSRRTASTAEATGLGGPTAADDTDRGIARSTVARVARLAALVSAVEDLGTPLRARWDGRETGGPGGGKENRERCRAARAGGDAGGGEGAGEWGGRGVRVTLEIAGVVPTIVCTTVQHR